MDYAAKDYGSAVEYVKGKRVVVVGLQKSALDIAMECSIANGVENPCTVLYKTAHWNVLDYLPWGLPLGYLYLNRFSELLVHKPGEGFLLVLVATMLSPVRWAFSKFVETGIKMKLPLRKYGMVPNHSFHQEINACLISTVPKNFYDKVEEGSIKLKKSLCFSFCKEGVMVEGDDAPLETDLVILATGFRGDKLKDILVITCTKMSTFSLLLQLIHSFSLIRGCIPPRIPQLAVIGFSESLANLYTSEIRCRWLAELLDGTFKLPSIKEMEKKCKNGMYIQFCRALHIWYNDQLCKDMGWNPRRKKGLLAELFQPYGPMDY
ncbi:LOW QUALITY PROTEIN: FMO-like domain-containing protein, partial [Cephalotus follicularis]